MVRLLNVLLKAPTQGALQKARGIYMVEYSYTFQCSDAECLENTEFDVRISVRGKDPLFRDVMARDVDPHKVKCSLDGTEPADLPEVVPDSMEGARSKVAGSRPSETTSGYGACLPQLVKARFPIGGGRLNEDDSFVDDRDEIYIRVHLVSPKGEAMKESNIVTGTFS